MSKFAPMTASLLARKGEAMPSAVHAPKQTFAWAVHNAPAQSMPVAKPIAEHIERIAYAAPETKTTTEQGHAFKTELPQDHDRPRRLFVALSHAEHERLAIAAVKKDVKQHQIIHRALEAYFEKLAAETGCACIAGGACGCGTN